MVKYLLGKFDFYKVEDVERKRVVYIQAFNLNGTLGKECKNRDKIIKIPLVDMPTELVDIRMKPGSKTTVEMYFNNGWQLSFRLHNASSKIETSLKFDIQFVGIPSSIFTIKRNF